MREIFHITTVNSGVQTPESKDYLELPDMAALYHMCDTANAAIAKNPKALHVSLEHEDVIDGKPVTKKAIGGYINSCFIADSKEGSKRLMANLSLHVSDEKGPGEPMGDLIQEMLRFVLPSYSDEVRERDRARERECLSVLCLVFRAHKGVGFSGTGRRRRRRWSG
jgi:hypothetical protein